MTRRLLIAAVALFGASGCMSHLYISKPAGYTVKVRGDAGHAGHGTPLRPSDGNEVVTFAAGHFHDVEARFRQVPGVVATAVGYTGGLVAEPQDEEVVQGRTGHAMAVVVEFDPKKVTFGELLDVFFQMHDPTTPNRQGANVGSAFRSAIYHHTLEQRNEAAAMVRRLSQETGRRIVTFVALEKPFYLAKPDHQQYHEKFGTMPPPEPSWRSRYSGTESYP